MSHSFTRDRERVGTKDERETTPLCARMPHNRLLSISRLERNAPLLRTSDASKILYAGRRFPRGEEKCESHSAHNSADKHSSGTRRGIFALFLFSVRLFLIRYTLSHIPYIPYTYTYIYIYQRCARSLTKKKKKERKESLKSCRRRGQDSHRCCCRLCTGFFQRDPRGTRRSSRPGVTQQPTRQGTRSRIGKRISRHRRIKP